MSTSINFSQNKLKRILVIGGSSFLGRNFVEEVCSQIDFAEYQKGLGVVVRNRSEFSDESRFTIHEHDFADTNGVEFDYNFYEVILFSIAEVDFFGTQAVYINNVNLMRNFLSTLPHDYSGTVVYTSTLGALDRCKKDKIFEPLDEESMSFPTSYYGRAKFDSELMLKKSGFNYLIIRLPWCYGSNMNESHHFVRLIEETRKLNPIFWFNWPGRISTLSSKNFARALFNLVENSASKKVIHIYDPETISFGEMFFRMGELHGRILGRVNIPRSALIFLQLIAPHIPFTARCLIQNCLTSNSKYADSWTSNIESRSRDFVSRISSNRRMKSKMKRTQTCIVTGAAEGLGRSIAVQLSHLGYRLFLVDKNPIVQELAKSLNADSMIVDLSVDKVEELVSMADSIFSELDFLINNAGILFRNEANSDISANLSKVTEVNYLVPVLLTHKLLARFPKLKIINISSSSAYQILPAFNMYGSSKAALAHWSQTMTSTLEKGQVLTVVPGGMRTNLNGNNDKKTEKTLLDTTIVARKITKNMESQMSQIIHIGVRSKILRFSYRILPLQLRISLGNLISNNL